jgi:hypothetical protein
LAVEGFQADDWGNDRGTQQNTKAIAKYMTIQSQRHCENMTEAENENVLEFLPLTHHQAMLHTV